MAPAVRPQRSTHAHCLLGLISRSCAKTLTPAPPCAAARRLPVRPTSGLYDTVFSDAVLSDAVFSDAVLSDATLPDAALRLCPTPPLRRCPVRHHTFTARRRPLRRRGLMCLCESVSVCLFLFLFCLSLLITRIDRSLE